MTFEQKINIVRFLYKKKKGLLSVYEQYLLSEYKKLKEEEKQKWDELNEELIIANDKEYYSGIYKTRKAPNYDYVIDNKEQIQKYYEFNCGY